MREYTSMEKSNIRSAIRVELRVYGKNKKSFKDMYNREHIIERLELLMGMYKTNPLVALGAKDAGVLGDTLWWWRSAISKGYFDEFVTRKHVIRLFEHTLCRLLDEVN